MNTGRPRGSDWRGRVWMARGWSPHCHTPPADKGRGGPPGVNRMLGEATECGREEQRETNRNKEPCMHPARGKRESPRLSRPSAIPPFTIPASAPPHNHRSYQGVSPFIPLISNARSHLLESRFGAELSSNCQVSSSNVAAGWLLLPLPFPLATGRGAGTLGCAIDMSQWAGSFHESS